MLEAPPTPSRRPHLHALTGVRFFAALHVVLFHTAIQFFDRAHPLLRGVIGAGYASVSLFFVLSGFILAYTYVDPHREAPIARRRFWAARFARVYPVYALGLLLAIGSLGKYALAQGFDLAGLARTAGLAIAGTTLTQAWIPQFACVWNCPGWSLSVEAFFYLLFPFIALPVSRLASRHFGTVALMLWVASLVPPLVYLAVDPYGAGGGSPADHRPWLTAVIFNPLARLPEFLLGIACGARFVWRQERGEIERSALARHAALLSVGSLGLVLALLALSGRLPYVALHNGLLAPVFALLIMALATGRGVIARWCASPGLVMLGEASYALYILHVPLWSWVKLGARATGFDATRSWPLVAAFIAVSIILSVVVYRRIEVPARDVLRVRFAPARIREQRHASPALP